MPSNLIYETVLDTDGFLWIATDNGISRFDGKRFINYNTRNGLPSNEVINVFKQADGTIWANCYKQAPSYFDKKTNSFICLDDDKQVVELSKYMFFCPDDIPEKGFFFMNSLGYFIIKDKKIVMVKIYRSGNGNSKQTLFFDDQYSIVEGYATKKEMFYVQNYSFIKDNVEYGNIEIKDKYPFFQISFKKDAVFLFTKKSIHKLFNFKINSFSFESKKIDVPKEIKWFNFINGKLIISALDGTVYIYDDKLLQLQKVLSTNTNVNTVNVDINKNIWVATQNNGLHFYSQSIIKQETFPESINNNILCINKSDDQTLFVGSFHGEIYKKNKTVFSKFYLNNLNKSNSWVTNIHVFPRKTISTSSINLNINFSKNIAIYSVGKQLVTIKSSIKVNDSILILGCISGIYKFNVSSEKYMLLNTFKERILYLKKKNEQSFYFIANDGLYEYDLITNESKIIFSNNRLKNDNIKLFEVIDKNTLWISTYKGNLYQIRNGVITKNYSGHEQIPINIVELLNLKNKLWIASKEGIYILNYQNKSKYNIKRISKSDGIISDYINDIEHYKDTVFVATDKGISKIPTDNFTSEYTLIPKIISIKINNKIVPIASNFKLSSNETNIALELSGVDVTGHFKNLEYKLNDIEYSAFDGNFLNLQLKNGINNIKIRAIDQNNMVHPNVIELQFDISTPFYKTIWFWIMVSFLLTSLVLFWINKRKLNKQNLKFEQQLALEKQRTQITADLHDDIGSTLSSLQLNSAVANHLIKKDVDKAALMLNKIENQAKDLADKIGDIIWSMKPGKHEFTTLSNRIRNFTTDILGAIDCNYKITIDEEIDNQITDISSRKNIILIAKEAINNAAKYSKAKNIFILLKKEPNTIVMKIIDDGIGFDSTLENGNGLKNMRQRAKEINANFQIISGINEGSQIIVELPCH